MTRKKRRMYIVGGAMLLLAGAASLVLTALDDNLVFFYSPTDLQARELTPGQRIRVGGLVEEGSHQEMGDGVVRFRVTDLAHTIEVRYKGILPNLFREGQGVIAEGSMVGGDTFQAAEVLAKHDETYMPKEVADALKKSGRWKEGEATQ